MQDGKSETTDVSQPDGNVIFEVTCVPLKDADGRYTTVIRLARDVTAERRAQEERAKLEDELRQSQKLKAIGELAGGIAHDFNNILSVVMSSAQVLEMKTPLMPEQARYMDTIIKMTRRASDLTGKLLTFARKGKYLTVPLNIHEIVDNVCDFLAHSADKRIAVDVQFKAERAVVMGDPNQIQNAILNLGLNSCDAMPDGGELRFRTEVVQLDEVYCKDHADLKPGKYLSLSVSDTGVGMTEEVRGKLFQPFFTTKAEGCGTGLGLASVFGCVKLHNGAITIHSEPSKGTVVNLCLPLASDDVITSESREAETTFARGQGMILLVDDEEIVREITSDALGIMGYQVVECRDGATALEYYRKKHEEIDLVILDMVMPSMNGWDAFKEMKKINPEIKALLISGFARDELLEQARQEGLLGFVKKPIEVIALSQAVALALSKGPQ